MSSSKAESPVTKVIFLQKIFRFAGRSLKDLIIINNVCKDFEETMQAFHTFNLILYDSIIKKRHDEKYFHERSVVLLETAPAWIVYQWTIINEHDETQRELLKKLLLEQAQYSHKIMIRPKIPSEDPSTTLQLLRHILDSCVKLGIIEIVLHGSTRGKNSINRAIENKLDAQAFKLLLEYCVQHTDIKKMLEHLDADGKNCIIRACEKSLPFDSFKHLLDFCSQYADISKMLEHRDNNGCNCFTVTSWRPLHYDTAQLLVAHFPSSESFHNARAAPNANRRSALDAVKSEEVRNLLRSPDCWKRCRDWCLSQGIMTRMSSASSATATTSIQQQQRQAASTDKRIQDLELKVAQQAKQLAEQQEMIHSEQERTRQLELKLIALASAFEKHVAGK